MENKLLHILLLAILMPIMTVLVIRTVRRVS